MENEDNFVDFKQQKKEKQQFIEGKSTQEEYHKSKVE